jgi:hypothetical protein
MPKHKASKPSKPKTRKPAIAVRPPPAVDDFVRGASTTTSKRHDATTLQRYGAAGSMSYTTKDGTELRRVTYWLPADVAAELSVLAARHRTKDSHIATYAVCKLLGLKIPETLAHVGGIFPR